MAAVAKDRHLRAPAKRGERFQRWWVKFSYLDVKGRISLYKRLQRFAERGLDDRYALAGMYERFRGGKRPDERSVVWRDWLRGIDNGVKFAQLIAPYVPPAEVLAIAAGEDTADRVTGYRMATFVAEIQQKIRSALREALIYPIILIGALIGLLYFAAFYLMPSMTIIAPVEKWPPIPHALYVTTSFVRSWGWLVISLAITGTIVFVRKLPTWHGPLRKKLDTMWFAVPLTAYRRIQSASLLVILAAMGAGGNPLDESMRRVRRIASPWLRQQHLNTMQQRLAAGASPPQALKTGLFDPDVIGDLEDYHRANVLNQAMEEIGRDIVDDTIARVSLQATTVRYLIMFAFVIGILWIYGSTALLVMSMRSGAHT